MTQAETNPELRTVIVENEPEAARALQQLIRAYCPHLRIIGKAATVVGAQKILAQNSKVDLLFLDVELDDGTAMDLLEKLEERPGAIIFTTAHDKYAIQAFRYSAVEFLLKPIDPDELMESVQKVRTRMERDQLLLQVAIMRDLIRAGTKPPEKIVVRDRENIYVLLIREILYLKSDGAYTQLYLQDGRQILSSKNLKHFEGILADRGFVRLHHSYLVNPTHISHYDKVENQLTLSGEHSVPVALRKKELLYALFDRLGKGK